MRTSASATLDGEWAVPLCACQEVWEWSLAQALYTAAISLSVCVQGVGMRVVRVGGSCAVVWLTSEWHRVVCAVCVLHMILKVAPSSCIRSQSLIALLRFCCFIIHPLSSFSPPLPYTHTGVYFGDVQNGIHCKHLNCTAILAVRLH